jgi:hypothetical protein
VGVAVNLPESDARACNGASERRLYPLARLPETWRVALLMAIKPIVYPVHDFVERWYMTEGNLRLAKVRGTAMWWHFLGDEPPRKGEPQTAEEVIDRLSEFADRSKPLEMLRGR